MFEGHDYSREPSDKDKSAFDELISGTFRQCIILSYYFQGMGTESFRMYG